MNDKDTNMTHRKMPNRFTLVLQEGFGRTSLVFSLALSLLSSACTPLIVTQPSVQIQPTETDTILVTATLTPSPIPSPTVEVTPSSVSTPTEDPNLLTYKDEAGQEVTAEIRTYTHTNKNGQTFEIPQPPNNRAIAKYLADRLVWHPSGSDPLPILHDLAGQEVQDLLKTKYDKGWPPPPPYFWINSYPDQNASTPWMAILVTDVDGGTLAIGRDSTGSIVEIFVQMLPDQFNGIFLYPSTVGVDPLDQQYMFELAAQHQTP